MNAFYSRLHADSICHAAQMGVLSPSAACMFKLSIMCIFVHVCVLSMRKIQPGICPSDGPNQLERDVCRVNRAALILV